MQETLDVDEPARAWIPRGDPVKAEKRVIIGEAKG
jgi:hypothetical protein